MPIRALPIHIDVMLNDPETDFLQAGTTDLTEPPRCISDSDSELLRTIKIPVSKKISKS